MWLWIELDASHTRGPLSRSVLIIDRSSSSWKYLRFKEKLKQDSKLLRQLLKYDATSDDNLRMDSESEVQSSKPFAEAPEQDNDVILIDMDENSGSTSGSSSVNNHHNQLDAESSGPESSSSHKEPPVSPGRTLFSNKRSGKVRQVVRLGQRSQLRFAQQ